MKAHRTTGVDGAPGARVLDVVQVRRAAHRRVWEHVVHTAKGRRRSLRPATSVRLVSYMMRICLIYDLCIRNSVLVE